MNGIGNTPLLRPHKFEQSLVANSSCDSCHPNYRPHSSSSSSSHTYRTRYELKQMQMVKCSRITNIENDFLQLKWLCHAIATPNQLLSSMVPLGSAGQQRLADIG